MSSPEQSSSENKGNAATDITTGVASNSDTPPQLPNSRCRQQSQSQSATTSRSKGAAVAATAASAFTTVALNQLERNLETSLRRILASMSSAQTRAAIATASRRQARSVVATLLAPKAGNTSSSTPARPPLQNQNGAKKEIKDPRKDTNRPPREFMPPPPRTPREPLIQQPLTPITPPVTSTPIPPAPPPKRSPLPPPPPPPPQRQAPQQQTQSPTVNQPSLSFGMSTGTYQSQQDSSYQTIEDWSTLMDSSLPSKTEFSSMEQSTRQHQQRQQGFLPGHLTIRHLQLKSRLLYAETTRFQAENEQPLPCAAGSGKRPCGGNKGPAGKPPLPPSAKQPKSSGPSAKAIAQMEAEMFGVPVKASHPQPQQQQKKPGAQNQKLPPARRH